MATVSGKRPRHPGLNREELQDLRALYANYYTEEGGMSLRDLAQMYALEQKGTDAQVARLLYKYKRTLESEFD